MKIKRLYVVYEERAITEGPDEATVMVSCDSLKEAESYSGQYGKQCPVYSYAIVGKQLVDEKFEKLI